MDQLTEVKCYARRTIPARIKRAVVERDGMLCHWCRRSVAFRGAGHPNGSLDLHFDHVTPWAEGGPSTVDNLVVACADCNLRRPKPRIVTRQSKVQLKYRYGSHFWPDGYTPPRAMDRRGLCYALPDFVRAFRLTLAESVRLIDNGTLPASTDGPIMVQVPEGFAPQRVRRARRDR